MAEFEIQKALFSAINAAGILAYDSAPQQSDGASLAVFPHVEVGAIVLGEFDTNTETGFDFVARIHTRSRSASMKEAKDIQGQIYGLLHRVQLTIAGGLLVDLQRVQSFCDRAPDGSFHGVCEYRGLFENAG